MSEFLVIMLVVLTIIAVVVSPIWFMERLLEFANKRKTQRKYNDFENIYFDYDHNIWVNKVQPQFKKPHYRWNSETQEWNLT